MSQHTVRRKLKALVGSSAVNALADVRGRLQATYYSGEQFRCPYCKKSFRKFLSTGFDSGIFKELKVVGGGARDNARCPRCGSVERERLLCLYLDQMQDAMSNYKNVLHFAPERNLGKKIKGMSEGYTTTDLKSKSVDMNFDITSIPFPEDSFDLIVCNHVLEHVPDDLAAMSEIFRVLQSHGVALLQVPLAPSVCTTREGSIDMSSEQKTSLFGQFDHVRLYGTDYVDRLRSVGFKVDPWNTSSQVAIAHGLDQEEYVYVCAKS